MDSLLKEAKNLNNLIKESSEYKEYKCCLKLKNNSQELAFLNRQLEEEKNKVCLKNNKESVATDLYYQIKGKIDSHPLMINYQNAYEKLNLYLRQIMIIINQDL